MDYLIASSQLVFEGSADTQIFLIPERADQSFLISFSGFLSTPSDDLQNFRGDEIIIYRGGTVKDTINTMMKRSEKNIVEEHHSFRRFPLSDDLKCKIIEWMFTAQMLETL